MSWLCGIGYWIWLGFCFEEIRFELGYYGKNDITDNQKSGHISVSRLGCLLCYKR